MWLKDSTDMQSVGSFNFCIKNPLFTSILVLLLKSFAVKLLHCEGVCVYVYVCIKYIHILKTLWQISYLFLSPFLKSISSCVLSLEGFPLLSVLCLLTQFWINTASSQEPHFYSSVCCLISPVLWSEPLLMNFSIFKQNATHGASFPQAEFITMTLGLTEALITLVWMSILWKASSSLSFPFQGRIAFQILPLRFCNAGRWGSWEEMQILLFL